MLFMSRSNERLLLTVYSQSRHYAVRFTRIMKIRTWTKRNRFVKTKFSNRLSTSPNSISSHFLIDFRYTCFKCKSSIHHHTYNLQLQRNWNFITQYSNINFNSNEWNIHVILIITSPLDVAPVSPPTADVGSTEKLENSGGDPWTSSNFTLTSLCNIHQNQFYLISAVSVTQRRLHVCCCCSTYNTTQHKDYIAKSIKSVASISHCIVSTCLLIDSVKRLDCHPPRDS